jgi:hypothetical protein
VIFSGFRRLISAIESLARSMEALANIQRLAVPSVDRLDALELSRHKFEAEVEGLLLKADGKLKAASNAEARERQLRKRERLLDPLPPDGNESIHQGDTVLPVDAEASEAQGVHTMHMGLAADPKAAALKAKWSG